MIIYLVTAPGHENTGYGDGILEGSHPQCLVSFLEYADRVHERKLRGFVLSDPATRPAPPDKPLRRRPEF